MASLQKIYENIIKPRKAFTKGTDQTLALIYNDNNQTLNNLNIKHEPIRNYIYYCYQRKHDALIDFAHIDINIKNICELYVTGLRIASQLANQISYHYESKKPLKTTTLAITYQQINNNLEQIATILNAVDNKAEKTSPSSFNLLLDEAKVRLLNQLNNFITLASNSFLGTRKRPCKRFELFANKQYFMQGTA